MVVASGNNKTVGKQEVPKLLDASKVGWNRLKAPMEFHFSLYGSVEPWLPLPAALQMTIVGAMLCRVLSGGR